jgi:hypothetical protein
MPHRRDKIIPVTIFLMLLALLSAACRGEKSLTVQEAWAYPAQENSNGAIYFRIVNQSDQEDVLIGAATEISAQVEIHQSRMDSSGTMTMEHQPHVSIPAGGTVAFEPGGLHVMLIGIQKELKAGDQIPLQLTFENAGEISVMVAIREP